MPEPTVADAESQEPEVSEETSEDMTVAESEPEAAEAEEDVAIEDEAPSIEPGALPLSGAMFEFRNANATWMER